MTVLQPAWMGAVTDWLHMLVGWSSLLVVGWVSHTLTRLQTHQARSWWWASAGLFAYALGRTYWLVQAQYVYPYQVPVVSWLDLFIALQYPCFLVALLLLPRARPGIQHALWILDACLLLGAALALSWYFLLAPIYLSSHLTPLSKVVNLSYPLGDLAILFGLTMAWIHLRAYGAEGTVLAVLLVASACLVVGDTWYAFIVLSTASYQSGGPPDLFWLAFYLLVPLAALLRLRLTLRHLAGVSTGQTSQRPPDLRRQDLMAGLHYTTPVAAAVLASTVLFIRAARVSSAAHLLAAPVVSLLLLGLALLRQFLTMVDNERLRREREVALRESTAQMETFLGVAGHELKNPLASIRLGRQLLDRRIRRLLQRDRVAVTDIAPLLEPVAQVERQEKRLDQFVNDLVDVTRVQAGRLDLHPAPTDLAAIVREAVEELQSVHPERTLLLEVSAGLEVPLTADATRLEQVVTNYLSNALKYAPSDRPIEVGLQRSEHQARVWVRDAGPGLPPEEQEHIWERFHRAQGIAIQNSDSGVGLGLGLHICRTIIEQHHGQVGVQSAPGQGSTFWFNLPLAPQGPATEEGTVAGAPEGAPGIYEPQP
jgi:signal transduction histidine kinase